MNIMYAYILILLILAGCAPEEGTGKTVKEPLDSPESILSAIEEVLKMSGEGIDSVLKSPNLLSQAEQIKVLTAGQNSKQNADFVIKKPDNAALDVSFVEHELMTTHKDNAQSLADAKFWVIFLKDKRGFFHCFFRKGSDIAFAIDKEIPATIFEAYAKTKIDAVIKRPYVRQLDDNGNFIAGKIE